MMETKLQKIISKIEKRHSKKIDLSLDRTFNLLNKLGNPQNKIKNVVTVVGTRPELIRLSSIIKRLEKSKILDHYLVHTGQNYDYELNEVFFNDLNVRQPDFFLDSAGSSLAETISNII